MIVISPIVEQVFESVNTNRKTVLARSSYLQNNKNIKKGKICFFIIVIKCNLAFILYIYKVWAMDNLNIFIASITSKSVRLLARITTAPNQPESELTKV